MTDSVITKTISAIGGTVGSVTRPAHKNDVVITCRVPTGKISGFKNQLQIALNIAASGWHVKSVNKATALHSALYGGNIVCTINHKTAAVKKAPAKKTVKKRSKK